MNKNYFGMDVRFEIIFSFVSTLTCALNNSCSNNGMGWGWRDGVGRVMVCVGGSN